MHLHDLGTYGLWRFVLLTVFLDRHTVQAVCMQLYVVLRSSISWKDETKKQFELPQVVRVYVWWIVGVCLRAHHNQRISRWRDFFVVSQPYTSYNSRSMIDWSLIDTGGMLLTPAWMSDIIRLFGKNESPQHLLLNCLVKPRRNPSSFVNWGL